MHSRQLLPENAPKTWPLDRWQNAHVLGSLRVLNRLDLVNGTLRAALKALAESAPDRGASCVVWGIRRRIEDFRLLKGKEVRRRCPFGGL